MTDIGVLFVALTWLMTLTSCHCSRITSDESTTPCSFVPLAQSYAGTNADLALDCRNRHLKGVPVKLFNNNITQLDLSLNNIQILPALVFNGLARLRKLNISQCGITQVSTAAFDDLTQLEELDIKNNPFINVALPNGVFRGLSNLRKLYISDNNALNVLDDITMLGNLSRLEEIALSPRSDKFPYALQKLPRIRRIYFIFGNLNILTQAMIRPLREAHIEEIAFVSCGLRLLELHVFEGLKNLRVLNVGGNELLTIDNVIDVLSSSPDIAVSTLILDQIDSMNHMMILGQREHPVCRPAWSHVEKLSARGTNIVAITETFKDCLPKLTAISLGFNSILRCGKDPADCLSILMSILHTVQYLDVSYLMMNDKQGLEVLSGYNIYMNWIKLNDDYFPAALDSARRCSRNLNVTPSNANNRTHCLITPLPPCLTYLRFDHLITTVYSSIHGCKWFSENNLEYLNASTLVYNVQPQTYDTTWYGLMHLRVVDFSGLGQTRINWNLFHDSLSTLRILIFANNLVGIGKFTPAPSMPHLEHLDLSDNSIHILPMDAFFNLTNLQYLNLAGNQLTTLRLILPATLRLLDLSRNLLTNFDASTRASLDGRRMLKIHVETNPLQCNCPDIDSVNWFQTTSSSFVDKETITCEQQTGDVLMRDVDVSKVKLRCGLTVNIISISSATASIAVATIIISVLIYRYRWQIKWRYYKLRYLNKRRQSNRILLGNPGQGDMYSAYVVYPDDDDTARQWVTQTLLPRVEQGLQKPPMFIRGRDDLAGESIINETVRGILQSQTALWVISPAFFRDHYCTTAANFSFHQLGANNNLILILDNRLDHYPVPRNLASLMNPGVGVPRLRYTDNAEGRELFWAKLDAFVPSWTCVPRS